MEQIEKFLSSHALFRRLLIAFIVVIFCCIDWLTGYEVAFSLFYLFPISIAAWLDNKRFTIFTIAAAGVAWFIADHGSGNTYTHAWTPYWNVTARMSFFCIVAVLLFKIRKTLKELTKLAMKDTLTSLDNSRAFNMEYQYILKNKSKHAQKLAIGIIDLDGFKSVNDTYGHSKGDDILVEFAQILRGSTRQADTVARLGGDEFVVILHNTDRAGTEEYAKRLRDIFDQSGLKDRYGVDFSMGISLFQDLPENLDEATHQADQLMYTSKMLGKSQTTIKAA